MAGCKSEVSSQLVQMTMLVPLRELLSWERHTNFRFTGHQHACFCVSLCERFSWCKCVLVVFRLCASLKGVCFLRCSALLASVQVHIHCRWGFFPPILLVLPEALLSDCYPHHQSSMIPLWSAALLEGSNFLWIGHRRDHPWSGSGGGPSLVVACRGSAHPATLHCSFWECHET